MLTRLLLLFIIQVEKIKEFGEIDEVEVVDDVDNSSDIKIQWAELERADSFQHNDDTEYFIRFRITKPTALQTLQRIEHN